MKIRLEGTEKQISEFTRQGLNLGRVKVKSVSKFYPNRVNSNDILNGLVDTKNPEGRIYVEIAD